MSDGAESSTSSSKKYRRFAPEPISTSTRSSRKPPVESSEPPTIRIEDAEPTDEDRPKETTKARRKFAVEPVSSTTRSNHNQAQEQVEEGSGSLQTNARTLNQVEGKKEPKPRRFKPEVIETTKRSRKSGDDTPALLPGDKTNVSPGDITSKSPRPTLRPTPPVNSPAGTLLEMPMLKPFPMRQGSMRPHNNTRANTRQRSFKVPTLTDIDSSESDETNRQSLSPSQKASPYTSDEGRNNKPRRHRGSGDEDISGYLLALAAKAAEKQLRDQEAAAFINTDYHEPVAHFMDRSDSDDSTTGRRSQKAARTRRDSDDEKAELRQMQKHGEKLQRTNKLAEDIADANGDVLLPRKSAWAGPNDSAPVPGGDRIPKRYIGGYQRCPDLKMMRKHASPPMLGGDIDFPRCASPDHARFDVTQGADYLRRSMCYLTEQSKSQTGLWGHQSKRKPPDMSRGVNGDGNPNLQKETGADAAKALWGGFCNGKEEKGLTPKGLMTPMRTPMRTPVATPVWEKMDPFRILTPEVSNSSAPAPPRTPALTPLTPPESNSPTKEQQLRHLKAPSITEIETRLNAEARIEEEFSDLFVTQVYNYLSFGYPALARKFDEELSSVSKVSVAELREDDNLSEARGFVRLEDDEFDGTGRSIEEPSCRRWRGLRRYIREWGRQMIAREGEQGEDGVAQWGVEGVHDHNPWGLRVRRGSWGI